MDARGLARYAPPLFFLLSTGTALFLFVSFVDADIFGFQTLGVILFGVLLNLSSLVISLPRIEDFLRSRERFGRLEYWLIVFAVFLAGLIVLYLGVGLGGVEYTRFMAQQS